MNKIKPNLWEHFAANTQRMKVFGGWLIKSCDTITSTAYQSQDRSSATAHTDYNIRTATTFVPDPEHQWDVWTKAEEMGITLEELISS